MRWHSLTLRQLRQAVPEPSCQRKKQLGTLFAALLSMQNWGVSGRWVIGGLLLAAGFVGCADDNEGPGGGAGAGGEAAAGEAAAGKAAGEAAAGGGGGTAGTSSDPGGCGAPTAAGAGGFASAEAGAGGYASCLERECGGCDVGTYVVVCAAGDVYTVGVPDVEDAQAACELAVASETGEGGNGGAAGGGAGGATQASGGADAGGFCDTYRAPGTRILECGSDRCTETESETKSGECHVAGECCVVVWRHSCGV
jgi:hypothetical protein